MEQAAAQHPLAFFTGAVLGAIFVGLVCGLIPLVAGTVMKQKKTGVVGFFTCLLGSLIGGALIAIPLALGFTIAAVVRRKEGLPDDSEADKGGANGT